MTQRRRSSRGASRQQSDAPASGSARIFGAGFVSGLFVAFIVYLVTLPPEGGDGAAPAQAPGVASTVDKQPLEYEFWDVLPSQDLTVEVDPADIPPPRGSTSATGKQFLLQAGSFRQKEDAERRRAELILLSLDPRIEETRGDNGRWFRVVLGPFDSRSSMARARSLTAQQDIDTLLMQRDVN